MHMDLFYIIIFPYQTALNNSVAKMESSVAGLPVSTLYTSMYEHEKTWMNEPAKRRLALVTVQIDQKITPQ